MLLSGTALIICYLLGQDAASSAQLPRPAAPLENPASC